MFEIPSQEQIDEIMHKAHVERARVMREGVAWLGRKVATPFRAIAHNPAERRS